MTIKSNTMRQKLEKVAKRQQHFGIRKLTIGAASVLLGTTLWMGINAENVEASEADKDAAASNPDIENTVNQSPTSSDTTNDVNTADVKDVQVNVPDTTVKAPETSSSEGTPKVSANSGTPSLRKDVNQGGSTDVSASNGAENHASGSVIANQKNTYTSSANTKSANQTAQKATAEKKENASSATQSADQASKKAAHDLTSDKNTVGVKSKQDKADIDSSVEVNDITDAGVKGKISDTAKLDNPNLLATDLTQDSSTDNGSRVVDSSKQKDVSNLINELSEQKDESTEKSSEAQKQKATLTIIDKDTGQQISENGIETSFNVSGNSGDTIVFPDNNAESEVKQLQRLGYIYSPDYSKSDEYSPTHEVYDNDPKTLQDYVIRMCAPQQYTNKGTLTVRFVDSTTGEEIHEPDKSLSVTFIKRGYNPWSGTNYKNGKIVNSNDQAFGSFNLQDNFYTYGYIDMPVIKGYVYAKNDHANNYNHDQVIVKQDANGKWITGGLVAPFDQLSQTLTLLYCPLAKIHQVDTNGRDITTPTQYEGNPTDPTKAGVTDVPDVPAGYEIVPMDQQPNYGYNPVNMGYDPNTNKVTPKFPTTNTVIVYQKVQQAKLKIVDQDNNYQQIEKDGVKTDFTTNGQPGDQISFNSSASVQALENDGYVYVNTDLPSNASFDNYDDSNGATQNYVIVMKHGTKPVGPNNPEDKDGLRKSDLSTTVKRTINYVDTDNNKVNGAPDGNNTYTQEANFTRTAIVDKVTGDIIGYDVDGDGKVDINPANKDSAWVSKNNTFDKVDSKDPTKLGYDSVDTKSVDEVTVAWNSPSKTINVIYSKKPEIPTKQEEKANLKIFDINQKNTDGKYQQIGDTFNASGDDNTQITFTNAQTTIDSLIKAGYKVNSIYSDGTDLKNTDYASASKDWKFDNKPSQDQKFVVYLEHDTEDINKNNNHGIDLHHTLTETVHYKEDGTDNTVAGDAHNSVDFDGKGTIDKVTGKLIEVEQGSDGKYHFKKDAQGNWVEKDLKDTTPDDFIWSTSNPFQEIKSPDIKGMHFTRMDPTTAATENGKDVKSYDVDHNTKDWEITVYYAADPVYTHSAGLKIYTGIEGQDESEFVMNGSASINNAQPGSDIKFGYKDNLDSLIKAGYTVKDVKDVTDSENPKTLAVSQSYDEIEPQFGKISSENKNTDQEFAIYLTKPAPKSQQSAQLVIYDDTDKHNLADTTQSGVEGNAIDFSSLNDKIEYYLKNGYKWENATYNGSDDKDLTDKTYSTYKYGAFDDISDTDKLSQKWIINLVHDYTPVNPGNPDNKDGYTKDYLDRTITRKVSYINNETGKEMDNMPEKTQSVEFKGSGYLDKVTGKWVTVTDGKITGPSTGLTWQMSTDGGKTWTGATSTTFDKLDQTTPSGYHITNYSGINVSGYEVDGGNVTAQLVDKDTQSSTVTIYYSPASPTKTNEAAHLTVIDDTNGNTLLSYGVTGQNDDSISFKGASDELTDYLNNGYEWEKASYNKGDISSAKSIKDITFGNFDNDPETDQDWTIYLVHKTNKIDHNTPGHADLEKKVTRTVNYVDQDGNPIDIPVTSTVTFEGIGTMDEVTHHLVTVDSTGKVIDWTKGELTWTKSVDGKAAESGNTYTFDPTDEKQTIAKNNVIYNYNHVDNKIYDGGNGVVKKYDVDATKNPQDLTVNVIYSKKTTPTPTPENQDASLTVIDENTGKQLSNYTNSGQPNTLINFGNASTDIQNYLNNGYVWDATKTTGNAEDYASLGINKFDNDSKISQAWTVYLKHGIDHVTHDKPGHGYTSDNLQRTVTTIVNYVTDDGTVLTSPLKNSTTFTADAYFDKVTGGMVTIDKDGNIAGPATKLTWTADKNFNAIPTKSFTGYDYKSGYGSVDPDLKVNFKDGSVSAQTMTPITADSNITFVYTKHVDVPVTTTGKLTYIDDTTGNNLSWVNFHGTAGNHIDYNATDQIKNYEDQGYDLVSDNFDQNGQTPIFDKDASKNVFEIHLKHAITPITPENPGKPGDKVPKDPKNPNEPDHKYPDNYEPQTLTKTITRDVTYVMADGSKAPSPVHQEVKFTGKGVLDLVTGHYVTVDQDGKLIPGKITWSQDKDGYDSVPELDTTKYEIIRVTESNTKANVDTKTGAVDGEKVTSDNQNSNIVITLNKKSETPPAKDQGSLKVIFHDDTTNQDIPGYGTTISTTDVGTKVSYTPNTQITDLENKGYDYVSTEGTIPTTIVKGDTVVTIHLVHATTPIDHNNPGKPGDKVPKDPTKPNEPDHKYPDNYVPQTLTKTITRDVTYVMADGSKAPDPVHQTVTFNGNGILDLVTGGLVTVDKDGKITPNGQITWTAENGDSFAATDPVAKNGYKVVSTVGDVNKKVDQATGAVASDKVTQDSDNQSIIIVLNKGNEKPDISQQTRQEIVHYVDENGKSIIPDTVNDDHTFIKVNGTWTENNYQYKGGNVPVIPGYVATIKTFEGASGTPDKDAEVTITYKKIGTIIPVDKDGNEIPGQQHPQFKNDPNDPTKVIDGQKPSVPGYKPETGKAGDPVHPDTDPSKDVKVPYIKDDDSIPATGSITYVDETTGKTLKTDPLNGNVGEKITYTTQDKINDYINQGYKLESSDFKDGNETFQKDGNTFTVKLIHDTVPVKPGDKTKPGDPINNPNKDPNGPKYPDGVSQDDLTTTTSRHIVYRDENGHLVNGSPEGKSSYLQTAHFGRTAIVDKVTGQILGYDTNGDGKVDTQDGNAAWQSLDNTFDAVASQDPSKLGYDYVDKSSVGKVTVGAADKDSVVYVTYGKNTTPEPQPTLPSSNPSSTPTTNPAPSNPTEPIEPSTPEPNIPDTPEPDIPETPKHHKKTPTPKRTNTDYAPQAENANTNTIMPIGETILSNGKIVDSDENVIGYIDKSGQTHYALPQTGENDNEDVAALIAGGVAVSMSLLGLAGVKKRRQN